MSTHGAGSRRTVRIGVHECHVVVYNASGSGHGVSSMTLDGVALTSPAVTLGSGASRHELRVVLGAVAKAAE